MDQLDSLNYATDTLSMQAPAVVQRVLSQSPTQQVQDDQCNKFVQISTHQQIHHVVSKELLPLSTNDCTSTNCDQSLLNPIWSGVNYLRYGPGGRGVVFARVLRH